MSGAANPLWLTEWLAESLDLQSGMRVLDLGCGRALSVVMPVAKRMERGFRIAGAIAVLLGALLLYDSSYRR